MYACMYVCMYVCMHVCMYVIMYVPLYPRVGGAIAPNHDDRIGRGLVGILLTRVVERRASPAHVSEFLADALSC